MNGCTDIVPGVKIIIISRNPLDACVSRYYHAFNPYKSGWPFPAWAAVWLSGNSGYGSWFTWVRDWYDAAKANSDQVLWIQYEDMQKNSYDEIEKIRKFLNIQNDVADNFDLIFSTSVVGKSIIMVKNRKRAGRLRKCKRRKNRSQKFFRGKKQINKLGLSIST